MFPTQTHTRPRPAWGESAVVIVVLALAALAWWPALATHAERQIDAGLKRALVSFAVARGINAILSVAQGTAVSAQPLGVGVTLSLGQVLEPVNRIVEQFSTVMLVASVAFGIEKVLLQVGSWWPVSAALSLACLLWCWTVAFRGTPHRKLSHALCLLLVLRFAVPVVAVGGDYLFRQFLSEGYSTSVQVLERVQAQVQRVPTTALSSTTKSWAERLKDVALAPIEEAKKTYESIRSAAESAIERMVQLIVIFVVQTILMPILLSWALWRAVRALVDSRGATATAPTIST